MTGRIMIALAALGIATAANAPDVPIAMTVQSWGRTLQQWTIRPDGGIRSERLVDRPGGDFQHYNVEVRETPASPPRYRWIADLLQPIRSAKPRDCKDRTPDMVYGSLVWGDARQDFDSGCTDRSDADRLARLKRADAQV